MATLQRNANGAATTFARLKHARAIGDLETLRGRALPAERITLHGEDPAAELRELTELLQRLL